MALTRIDLRLYAKVKAIIAKYGKDAVFTTHTTSRGYYDPTTGTVANDSGMQYPVKITPPAPAETMFPNEILATELHGKSMVMFAAKDLEFTPAPGMKVTIDDQQWTVMPPVRTWFTGQLKALYGVYIER